MSAESPATDVLTVSEDGPVRIVRLNRPQALNAIDEVLHTALTDIWQQLDSDRGSTSRGDHRRRPRLLPRAATWVYCS